MILYCRDCRRNVKTRKEKSKNKYEKVEYYYCQECGVIVMSIFENRRP